MPWAGLGLGLDYSSGAWGGGGRVPVDLFILGGGSVRCVARLFQGPWVQVRAGGPGPFWVQQRNARIGGVLRLVHRCSHPPPPGLGLGPLLPAAVGQEGVSPAHGGSLLFPDRACDPLEPSGLGLLLMTPPPSPGMVWDKTWQVRGLAIDRRWSSTSRIAVAISTVQHVLSQRSRGIHRFMCPARCRQAPSPIVRVTGQVETPFPLPYATSSQYH